MNVILDVNVVLDLLLRRKEYFLDQKGCFQVLLEGGASLYFPACALPTLAYVHLMELKRLKKAGAIDPEQDLKEVSRKQLSALFDEINICTSLAAHWKIIPDEHPDCEDALISLSASILPGDTVIWTEDKDFRPVGEILAVGNHKTVQATLIECHEGTQFIDLVAQQKVVRPKLELGLYAVLRHGQYIMGPEVRELEARLAEYVGMEHCITCASGTDALLMALMAFKIGPGDEVITVPYTWISSAEVIALLQARPVFVDILPDTFKLDIFPQELKLRQEIAQRYSDFLASCPSSSVSDPMPSAPCSMPSPPHLPQWGTSAWAQYTILAEDRDHLSEHLKAAGIPSVAYYTRPLHLQGAFQDLGHQPGDFPVAEQVAARCLSLPMSPYLSEAEQENIANTLKAAG